MGQGNRLLSNLSGQPFRRSKPAKATPALSYPGRPTTPAYDWGRADLTPGKGKKDGNCNRTACQAPLKGGEQWYMRDYGTTNGRLYYCGRCARQFNDSDRQFKEPQRCTFDEDADMSESFAQ
jgi:hypothetical protein